MGAKIGHRQTRKPNKPRSIITRDMILNNKGGPHKDRSEKRQSNKRNRWEEDWKE